GAGSYRLPACLKCARVILHSLRQVAAEQHADEQQQCERYRIRDRRAKIKPKFALEYCNNLSHYTTSPSGADSEGCWSWGEDMSGSACRVNSRKISSSFTASGRSSIKSHPCSTTVRAIAGRGST